MSSASRSTREAAKDSCMGLRSEPLLGSPYLGCEPCKNVSSWAPQFLRLVLWLTPTGLLARSNHFTWPPGWAWANPGYNNLPLLLPEGSTAFQRPTNLLWAEGYIGPLGGFSPSPLSLSVLICFRELNALNTTSLK